MASIGVTHLFGPEIEGGSSVTPRQWAASADALGLKVIMKDLVITPPTNCVGFFHPTDEPNGKGVLPATLKPEYDRLKLLSSAIPVFLSLAGDKLVYDGFPNANDKQLYLDYAKYYDVATVNFYSKNRNADRYPVARTATVVRNLIALTNKPVWAWIEVNDQELGAPPAPDINRAPTPQEIEDTFTSCLNAGASGAGWFATTPRAHHGWPGNYWPPTDRNGASMQPQYDRLKAIASRVNGMSLEKRVKDLEDWRATHFMF